MHRIIVDDLGFSVVASSSDLPLLLPSLITAPLSTDISSLSAEVMADWGPVFVAVVLFVLLTPGLLVQIPGKNRLAEFANMQTSGISIFIHSIIYFAALCILLLAVGVHVYAG